MGSDTSQSCSWYGFIVLLLVQMTHLWQLSLKGMCRHASLGTVTSIAGTQSCHTDGIMLIGLEVQEIAPTRDTMGRDTSLEVGKKYKSIDFREISMVSGLS